MQIRNTLKEDIPEIARLYNHHKIEKELEWVFANPENDEELHSLVAVDKEGKIIGVIGYKLSTYHIGNTKLVGSMPLSWMVDKNHKGFAGINLFKKVTEMGDFFLNMGGSQDAKTILPVFKLSTIGTLHSFNKAFSPIKYYNTLQSSVIKNLANTLLTYPGHLLTKKQNIKDVELLPFNKEFHADNHFIREDVFHKELTPNYINWLLNCPLTDGYAFHITYKGKYLGEVVCFRKEINNTYRGRIVHLSYLGDDLNLWKKVIYAIEKFMISIGCISLNAVASNPMTTLAFKKMNFYNHVGYQKSVYIKDSQNVLDNIDLTNWHVQYSEADKSYRNI